MNRVTYQDVQNDITIRTYIKHEDEGLAALGYTEHSFAHVTQVAERAGYILETLGYPQRTVELVKIASYLHDIGNIVNRVGHSQSGAIMAFSLLSDMNVAPEEIAPIVMAIGNHDEGTGQPVSALAAALILADKSDVRRSRVRNQDIASFDIHDRVNYSAVHTMLTVDQAQKQIRLDLTIDTAYGSVMDYFVIFMDRMKMCQRAASALGLEFKLVMNEKEMT